jgi:hypothetical protein
MSGLEQAAHHGGDYTLKDRGEGQNLSNTIFVPENLKHFKAVSSGNDGEFIHVVDAPTASPRFKDNPKNPPAVRAVEALIDLEQRGIAITPEHKAAFEDAIIKADQEMKNGVSPRFRELKERLDRLDSIREDLSKLPIETGIRFLALEQLRQRGPEAAEFADRELDKLVPGLKDDKTFSQRCKEVRDAGDLSPAGSRLLEANVILEQREDEAVRAYYAKALSTSRSPENDKRARQLITDIQIKYPDAEWVDPVVRDLLRIYGIEHRRPRDL